MLLKSVLIKEEDIVEESMRSRPVVFPLPGDMAFDRYIAIWEAYLAPTKEHSHSSKKTEGSSSPKNRTSNKAVVKSAK